MDFQKYNIKEKKQKEKGRKKKKTQELLKNKQKTKKGMILKIVKIYLALL